MRKPTPQHIVDKICDLGTARLYNAVQIGEMVGMSSSSISLILKKNGLIPLNVSEAHMVYRFNEHYFDNIDTEEKAYFLGLFYADGTNNPQTRCFQITLQERDIDILKKFKKEIGSEAPLYCIEPRSWAKQRQARFRLSSAHFTKQLSDKGVIRNKTFSLKFPHWIDDNLVRHFIRGVFDGDGYCGKEGASLTGTRELCTDIAKILYDRASVHSSIAVRRPERNNNNVSISFGGGRQMWRFYNFVYGDSSIWINRKYEVAKSVFEKYKNREDEMGKQYHIYTHRKLIPFYNKDSE